MPLLFAALCFGIIAWHRFHYSLALLFFLLPTYLIRFRIGELPGTFLEAMIWIITAVWCIKHCKSLKTDFWAVTKQHASLFIASALFLIAATIAVAASLNTHAALGEWKAFYIEPFIVFLILITSIKEKKEIHLILSALILSALTTSLLAIYQHFTGFMVPWAFWENGSSYRVTAWYGFPNGVGLFLAPLFPLAIYLLLHAWQELKMEKNWRTHLTILINLCFLFFAPFAILFAKSTGGLIGAAAGIGSLLLVSKKTRLPALALGGAALLAVFFFLPKENSIRQELLMQDRSGQIRVHMWGEAVELLFTRPLLGAGLASYAQRIVPYHRQVNGDNIEIFHHQHNIFLTMWTNLGILGLLAFLWIVVWFYRVGILSLFPSVYRHFPPTAPRFAGSPLTPYLLASMAALLVTGLVDSPYIKNDLAIFFWLLPGLMIASTERQK